MSGIQNQLNSYWSSRASAYHQAQTSTARSPFEQQLWAEVFTKALPFSEGTILDAGCGSGFVSHLLAAAGHTVFGMDSSPRMIDEARAEAKRQKNLGYNHAEFFLDNAIYPAWPARSFDAVTSRFLLWTLTDPVAALHSWARLVKPGGVVIAADGLWFPDGIDPDTEVDSTAGKHVFTRTYSAETMQNLPLGQKVGTKEYADAFRAAGLENIKVTPVDSTRELDAKFGLSKGHTSAQQFTISGVVTEAVHNPNNIPYDQALFML